jgi:hypothetical protein
LIGFQARRWLAVIVSLTLVLACAFLPTAPSPGGVPTVQPTAGGPASPPAAKASATAPAPTERALAVPSAWDQVLGQIQPDGTVTADTALQAFLFYA